MPIQVKPVDQVVKKWQARANVASSDYTSGVAASGTKQHDNAVAQATTWLAGVQAAGVNRYTAGLNRDPGKYQRNATGKGAQRYGPGVAAAGPDYNRAIGPVLAAIAAVNLPPKQPRGSPGNNDRVTAITTALHKLRTG